MSRYAIGVDLGGTNLRAAVIDESGKMIEKVSASTPMGQSGESPEQIVAEIVESVTALREKYGIAKLAGIGAGIPGYIIMETGVIAGWGNRPGFNGFPMRAELEKRLGTKVFLENDANAAAIGEHWIGAGQGASDLVLLTLGTGIGGGIISGGRILHGFLGMAAELGHMTVVPNGNPCGCGNRGCVEQYASATAVANMARGMHLGRDVTAEDVYNLAKSGNERAQTVFRAMGESLGIALASLINVFNFPLYLLAGGVLGAWDYFAPPMIGEIERRCFTYKTTLKSTPTRIERAVLGNEAGLFGSAYLPFEPRNS